MAGGKVGLAVYGLAREAFPRLGALLGTSTNVQLRWVVDRDPEAASDALQKSGLSGDKLPKVIKPWHWDQLCKDDG